MSIIGNVGGRHTSLKRVTVSVGNSGTGSNNTSVYQCPANTIAKVSLPQVFINAQTGFGTWQIVDGLSGKITNLTTNISHSAGTWNAVGWQPQPYNKSAGGGDASSTVPDPTGVPNPTTGTVDANTLLFFGRLNPTTGELVLRDGDLLRIAFSNFTPNTSSTVTASVSVSEETRG